MATQEDTVETSFATEFCTLDLNKPHISTSVSVVFFLSHDISPLPHSCIKYTDPITFQGRTTNAHVSPDRPVGLD